MTQIKKLERPVYSQQKLRIIQEQESAPFANGTKDWRDVYYVKDINDQEVVGFYGYNHEQGWSISLRSDIFLWQKLKDAKLDWFENNHNIGKFTQFLEESEKEYFEKHHLYFWLRPFDKTIQLHRNSKNPIENVITSDIAIYEIRFVANLLKKYHDRLMTII